MKDRRKKESGVKKESTYIYYVYILRKKAERIEGQGPAVPAHPWQGAAPLPIPAELVAEGSGSDDMGLGGVTARFTRARKFPCLAGARHVEVRKSLFFFFLG